MNQQAIDIGNQLLPHNSNREWRDVPDFEGAYIISSDGHVVSLPRLCAHVHGERTVKARVLKRRFSTLSPNVSVCVQLSFNGKRAGPTVASLMLNAFIGRLDGGIARCIDGNPENLNIENLKWASFSEIAKENKSGSYDYGRTNAKKGQA